MASQFFRKEIRTGRYSEEKVGEKKNRLLKFLLLGNPFIPPLRRWGKNISSRVEREGGKKVDWFEISSGHMGRKR